MLKKENTIQIGEVYREHGVSGGVKVYLYSGDEESLRVGMKIFLKKKNNEALEVTIKNIKPHQKLFLVYFLEVHHRDQAKELRKAQIHLNKTDLKALKNGEHYLYDLISFMVVDQEEKSIGKLIGLEGDEKVLYYKLKNNSDKEILIPCVPVWIKKIDVLNKKIVMELPQGLID